jgi:hypothetical protein
MLDKQVNLLALAHHHLRPVGETLQIAAETERIIQVKTLPDMISRRMRILRPESF